MVKIGHIPNRTIVAGLRGLVDFYVQHGQPMARAWPQNRHSGFVWNSVQASLRFARYQVLLKCTHPNIIALWRAVARPTAWTWREYSMKGYLGALKMSTRWSHGPKYSLVPYSARDGRFYVVLNAALYSFMGYWFIMGWTDQHEQTPSLWLSTGPFCTRPFHQTIRGVQFYRGDVIESLPYESELTTVISDDAPYDGYFFFTYVRFPSGAWYYPWKQARQYVYFGERHTPPESPWEPPLHAYSCGPFFTLDLPSIPEPPGPDLHRFPLQPFPTWDPRHLPPREAWTLATLEEDRPVCLPPPV